MTKQTPRIARRVGVIAALSAGLIALAGCEAMNGFVSSFDKTFADSGSQEAALMVPEAQRPKSTMFGGLKVPRPDAGPTIGTIRVAKWNNVSHNVALRGGRGPTRKYIVQRLDLQPMWATDKSREKALAVVTDAFGADACSGGAPLSITNVAHEAPVGIWVVDASCAPSAVPAAPAAQ